MEPGLGQTHRYRRQNRRDHGDGVCLAHQLPGLRSVGSAQLDVDVGAERAAAQAQQQGAGEGNGQAGRENDQADCGGEDEDGHVQEPGGSQPAGNRVRAYSGCQDADRKGRGMQPGLKVRQVQIRPDVRCGVSDSVEKVGPDREV